MLVTDNVEKLATLAADLSAGRKPSPEAADFVARGVARWLARDADSLDEAFGLRSGEVGRDHARSVYLRSERDRHLREAHRLCQAESAWQRSVALQEEVARFEAVIWPRWRDLDAPPAGCSELRRHLFLAAQAGRVDLSIAQLHSVCAWP